MSFVKDLRITDLGTGGGLAVWSFRAAATGEYPCCVIRKGFNSAFGEEAHSALGALIEFAQLLGSAGRRRILLARAGCCSVTADELSIIATLAAAQRNDIELCDAHLSWLMCGRGEQQARDAALKLSAIFANAKLTILSAPVELSRPKRQGPLPVFYAVGHA